jgi:hypothetical protein
MGRAHPRAASQETNQPRRTCAGLRRPPKLSMAALNTCKLPRPRSGLQWRVRAHPKGTVPRPGALRDRRSPCVPDTSASPSRWRSTLRRGRTHSPGAALPSFFLDRYKGNETGAIVRKAMRPHKVRVINALNRTLGGGGLTGSVPEAPAANNLGRESG